MSSPALRVAGELKECAPLLAASLVVLRQGRGLKGIIMPLFEIKHRYTGSVLFSLECGSMKLCIETAVKGSANLRSADLRSANLSSANLSSADLNSADLRFADLRFADLNSANFRSAKWPRDAVVLHPPVIITGLRWYIMLFGSHLQIGCELHSVAEWDAFDDEMISRMDSRALAWWKKNKVRILAFRDLEAERQFAEKQATPEEPVTA